METFTIGESLEISRCTNESEDTDKCIDEQEDLEEYVIPDTDSVVTVELETVTENPDGIRATQMVTLINLQQCNICSTFYEQVSKRLIPHPDVNRLICKILEVQPGSTPQENQKFFMKYISICDDCTKKAKLYEKLRLDMEALKNEISSSIMDTLLHIRPEGSTPIHDIKHLILKRWSTQSTVKVVNIDNAVDVTSSTSHKKTKVPFLNRKTKGKLRKSTTSELISTYTIVNETNSMADNVVLLSDTNNDDDDEYPNNWTIAQEVTVSAPDTTTSEAEAFDHLNKHNGYILPDTITIKGNVSDCSIKTPNRNRKGKYQHLNVCSKQQKSSNDSIQQQEIKRNVDDSDSPLKKRKQGKGYLKPPIPPHFCDECGRVFGKWVAFRLHKKNCSKDNNGRVKQCSLCSEDFSLGSWEDLKLHYNEIHSDSKLERCTSCRTDFLPNTLQFHSCGFKTIDYGSLQADFKCDICEKAYHTRSNLTDHVRRYHKGEEKWTCSSCSKTYSSKLLLEQHEKKHKKANSTFICKVCEASCTSSYGLKLHTRIHTGELPFKCKLCDKSFRSTSVLNNHMVTHTGERKHVCDLCGMKFALHGTMTRHWKRHQLPDTNYTKKCPLCLKIRFKKAYALIDHMNQFHADTPELITVMEKYKDIDDRPARSQKSRIKTTLKEQKFNKSKCINKKVGKNLKSTKIQITELSSCSSESDTNEDIQELVISDSVNNKDDLFQNSTNVVNKLCKNAILNINEETAKQTLKPISTVEERKNRTSGRTITITKLATKKKP